MSDHETVALNIVMQGTDYAFRSWPHVPRVGDHISLIDKETTKPRLAIVRLVVWGVREKTAFGRQLECDVHVLWDEPEVPKEEPTQ